jgi:release factor glutamine methyltransferase
VTASVHQLVAAAKRRFRGAGIPDAEADLDARLIAQEVLGWESARFLTSASEPAPEDFETPFESLVTRRLSREPLAYIVGHREFWNLDFFVSSAVLIPRPETELVVVAGLDLFPGSDRPIRVVDACTGSGCLAVAVAHERASARVTGTDVSPGALAIARKNVERHEVAGRVELLQTDLLTGLDGPFDLIVSNPPYVPEGEIGSLQPEVRDFEPVVALAAGPDGLAVIRRLLAQSATRLQVRGKLVFEFGFGQAAAVCDLISSIPQLELVKLVPDLQGIPRVAVASMIGS